MNTSIKEQVKKAPQGPGVYIFKNKESVLYIGKAVNLKKRLSQYLNKKTQSPFLSQILEEAENIEFKETDSEIEALILESRLIKELKPRYNIMLRDDKQYFYVVFTKEKFPKIFLTHQPRASEFYIGPFTEGSALKTALKLLRRIFPYCTCKQKHNNFCLNYHIGNCPGYCCLKNPESRVKSYESRNYKRNINAIKSILRGRKNSVVGKLKKELGQLADKQDFENAIKLHDQIEKLEKVFSNAKIIRDSETLKTQESALEKLKQIFKLPARPRRIEGYDISNIQGRDATGAMVVFTDGKPDPEGVASRPYGASKNEYRRFKIHFKKTPDDIAMLKEVLSRRFNHPEWPLPDLIFIDGGIAQLNIAKTVIRNSKLKIPVISLAKGKSEVFSTTLKKPIPMKKLPSEVQNLIKHIDSEAHRFALAYHRKIRQKSVYQ